MDGFRKFTNSEVHNKVRCGNVQTYLYHLFIYFILPEALFWYLINGTTPNENWYLNLALVHIRIKESFYIQKVYLSQSLSKKLLTWLYLTAQERIRSLTLFQGKLRTFQEAKNPAIRGALESLTEQVNLETCKSSSQKYFICFINTYRLPTAISSITWPFMKKKILQWSQLAVLLCVLALCSIQIQIDLWCIEFSPCILSSAHIYTELVRSSVHVNWQCSINFKRSLPIYTSKVAGL